MKTYRIKLITSSGILTPLQADTIFGHLCWTVAHTKGDNALQKFIDPFLNGKPPFIISDGFPQDLFPKPLTVDVIFKDSDEKKEIKKKGFVTLKGFNKLMNGEECEVEEFHSPLKFTTTSHTMISRVTGTVEEGALFNLEEYYADYFSIYIKVVNEKIKNEVVELMKELSHYGFGKKKSIGKGQFEVGNVEEFKFAEIEKANGFVTLSNFCPAENDPIEGFYKTFVKYGKLGEEFSYGNPFKRPLIMIKTGSVFKTEGKPKEFYGRIVKGIAPAKEEVLQYAYAFAVPVKYAKLERR